jgi:predicted esterase
MVVLDQPVVAGTLKGKRALLANGSHDPIVSNDHPPRLAALLRAGGATVSLHTSPTGHGLVAADLAAAQGFLAAG